VVDLKAPSAPPLPSAAAAALTTAARTREWRAPFPLDLGLTLSPHYRGPGDPTYRIDEAGTVWRTSLTPDGPGTIRMVLGAGNRLPGPGDRVPGPEDGVPGAGRVTAQAWGPGAGWLLDGLPALLGAGDDPSGFDPAAHPVLRDAARRHPGFRIGSTGRLLEALVPAILEQKVVTLEAHRAWRTLLAKYGTPPPGPAPRGMRVFPPPSVWRSIPTWEWHKAGVEGVRAQTIIRACAVASSLERLLDSGGRRDRDPGDGGSRDAGSRDGGGLASASRKLRTIPGIGVWTAAETLQRAAGDPDAVSVGDYHIPRTVGWALAGRDRTDDATMLELLRPYQGHRYRVTRLIELSGLRPPRRGPRMSVRDYRSF
jgi:3-methyladenine DNA glycosylase/8-oxoguanine DNA glycosylase